MKIKCTDFGIHMDWRIWSVWYNWALFIEHGPEIAVMAAKLKDIEQIVECKKHWSL